MLNTTLIHYIRSTLNQGYDRNAVYSYLLRLGWNARDIQDSLYFVEQEIRARQMTQPQLRMQTMQIPQPAMQKQPEDSQVSNFVIPAVSILLVLMIGTGVFLFTGFGKATVGAPTGIQPEEGVKLSPPKEAPPKETQQQEPVIISQEPQQGQTPAEPQETPQNNSQEPTETQQQEPAPAETQPTLTCLDQFGIKCLEGETCPGELLPAIDTDKCCSVVCE